MLAEEDDVPEGLDAILAEMASQGTLSSSGVFTIDVRAALPKLEKFQLPRPHFGILKVIQSAVASGASYVDSHFARTGITIEHDGEPPEPEELRDLFCYLLASDRAADDRALRDLAVGLNTTLARGASWVEVAVRHGDSWTSQRWSNRDETTQSETLEKSESQARVRFTVRRTLLQTMTDVARWANKDVFGLLMGSREVLDQDAQAVFDRCRHSPIPIRLNGRLVPSGCGGQRVRRRWSPTLWVEHRGPHLLEVYLQCDQVSPHLLSAPSQSEARHRFVLPGSFDGARFHPHPQPQLQPAPSWLAPSSCYAVLSVRGQARVPSEMTVVKDGVELTRLTPRLLPQGLSIVMAAEGLKLDLSQFRLVNSPDTQERISDLTSTAGWVAGQALEQLGELLKPAEQDHLKGLSGSLYAPM